jgi:hypothetical protein
MNKLFIICFMFSHMGLFAQDDYTVSLLSDTLNNRYRYIRVYTVDNDEGTDTVEIRFFPNKWLDTLELKNFQINQIDMDDERIRELRRLLVETNREQEFFIATMNSVYGPGTWDTIQHQRAFERIQGSWRLIDRGRSARPTEVTGYEIAVGAVNGTISIDQDFNIVVAGIYPFDLTFTWMPGSQTYRAIRGIGANQRIFILRR